MPKIDEIQISRFLYEGQTLLGAPSDPAAARLSVLERIGSILHCQWITMWEVDRNVLRACAKWTHTDLVARQLLDDVRFNSLASGEGTATRVWRSAQPFWTHDLFRDLCFPRSLEAKSAGLTAGIWIPLKSKGTVVAVLELLSLGLPESTYPDRSKDLERFGDVIGDLLFPSSPRLSLSS